MTLCSTQVRVADALYILLGVTPDNRGEEVYRMLQSWKDKDLHIGKNLVDEMDAMSKILKDRGFPEILGEDQRPKPRTQDHQRVNKKNDSAV